jgi:Transposase IS4
MTEENIEVMTEGLRWKPSEGEPSYFNSLSATSRSVIQLALSLPGQTRDYVIYFDNFFSNTRLLSALRFYNIAAAGTARSNSAEYLKEYSLLKKAGNQWKWGQIESLTVRDVSHICWRDRTLVRFMTTCYTTSESAIVERKRPHGSNAHDRKEIDRIWAIDTRKLVSQPAIAIDYNLYMGGVDIAD